MGYLVCKDCGDYYELQPGETANDPQNLRFWHPENKAFEKRSFSMRQKSKIFDSFRGFR